VFELFQPTHLLFVLLVALVVFGPKRLIEMTHNLGRTIQKIQEYKAELKAELKSATTEDEPDKKPSPEKKG
jgi:sec-independent protein translocase protein TatA